MFSGLLSSEPQRWSHPASHDKSSWLAQLKPAKDVGRIRRGQLQPHVLLRGWGNVITLLIHIITFIIGPVFILSQASKF